MRENVGVGGEGHQQSSDHSHTSKCGKDAFMQACVRKESLKIVCVRGAVTEEVMNNIGTAEWQAAYITGVYHGVQQSCCKSPCCHFYADHPGHDQGVKERAAYGHIVVIGH